MLLLQKQAIAETRVMAEKKRNPHAVKLQFPSPGHINPMLKLAKLLHCRHGFHITYFLTEDVHRSVDSACRSGLRRLQSLDWFRLEVVPDGLPPEGRTWDKFLRAITVAANTTVVSRVRERVGELQRDPELPRVSCLVSGLLGPIVAVAEEIGVPGVLFWTTSAVGFMGILYMHELIARCCVPLKDESFLSNGYLNTIIDWIPGLRPMRLGDISSFVRTTDPNHEYLSFDIESAKWASRASAVILNTFDDIEHEVLRAMEPKFRRLYTIGPLSKLPLGVGGDNDLCSLRLNLWKEDRDFLRWLEEQERGSVLYISFGSISTMEPGQLAEFAWGVAASNYLFLWVVRPNIVAGQTAALPEGFAEATEGRGYVCGWCPQEEMLAHPSVGGFVTHAGWNSMPEAIQHGVPMLCWLSVFADQPANCRYACEEWGVALEVGEGEVESGRVEGLVTELMGEGEVGRRLRERCMEWKEKAGEAVALATTNIDERAGLMILKDAVNV